MVNYKPCFLYNVKTFFQVSQEFFFVDIHLRMLPDDNQGITGNYVVIMIILFVWQQEITISHFRVYVKDLAGMESQHDPVTVDYVVIRTISHKSFFIR